MKIKLIAYIARKYNSRYVKVTYTYKSVNQTVLLTRTVSTHLQTHTSLSIYLPCQAVNPHSVSDISPWSLCCCAPILRKSRIRERRNTCFA